jgi:hypothetical protein
MRGELVRKFFFEPDIVGMALRHRHNRVRVREPSRLGQLVLYGLLFQCMESCGSVSNGGFGVVHLLAQFFVRGMIG